MAKHMPGPWTAEQSVVRRLDPDDPDRGDLPDHYISRGSHRIADVRGYGDEGDANAALIAAAPELAEACRTFLRWFDDGVVDGPTVAKAVRAALANAEGT